MVASTSCPTHVSTVRRRIATAQALLPTAAEQVPATIATAACLTAKLAQPPGAGKAALCSRGLVTTQVVVVVVVVAPVLRKVATVATAAVVVPVIVVHSRTGPI